MKKSTIAVSCIALVTCVGAFFFSIWNTGKIAELESQNRDDEIEGIKEELRDLQATINNLTAEVPTAVVKAEVSTTWNLALNLNPADNHIMDYTTGWSGDTAIGTKAEALAKDYIRLQVWNYMPVDYIAIVRHQHAIVDAVKVFRFIDAGIAMIDRFDSNNTLFYRSIVTAGGPIQEEIAEDAPYMTDDPIFSVDGDLAFNWGYANNGVRVALTGGHLSAADSGDDNTHGLGCNVHCNPITGVSNYYGGKLEISVIQDCAKNSGCWNAKNYRVMGTDHGGGWGLYSSTAVYGYYAIYVSQDATTFPGPGTQLEAEIVV